MKSRSQLLTQINQLEVIAPWWHHLFTPWQDEAKQLGVKDKLIETITTFLNEQGKIKQPLFFYCCLQMMYEYEIIMHSNQRAYLQYIQKLQEDIYQSLIDDVVIRTDVIDQLRKRGMMSHHAATALDNIMLILIDLYQQSVLSAQMLQDKKALAMEYRRAIHQMPAKLLMRLKNAQCPRLNTMANVLVLYFLRAKVE